MTTLDVIQRTELRLGTIYAQTRFELMKLGDVALTEMMHEADEYKTHAAFSERVVGEVISACAYMVLEERKQLTAKAPGAPR